MMPDIIRDPYSLTPVQDVDGLWMKREDLFAPFGHGDVNGGKLRQCMLLIQDEWSRTPHKGVITYCSINSPQAPITSAVCESMDIPCRVVYGGTSPDRLDTHQSPRLVKAHKGVIDTTPRSGRHNVLLNYARGFAEEQDYFIVQYGFNLKGHAEVLLDAVSQQVQNIPDELDNLVITCGSGITTSGVLLGLDRFGKSVSKVHLVCTAPNRDELIESLAGKHDYIRHDLYHRKGFNYDDRQEAIYRGIRFHPHYEAKTFKWLVKESNLSLHDGKTLLWVVGAEPIGW